MTLSLSHIDLDGYSCQIIIKHNEKNCNFLNCNYNNIDEYLDLLVDIIEKNTVTKVFVTDLSFDDHQMKHLNSIAEEFYSVKFIVIDHHPQTLSTLDNCTSNNIDVIIDLAKSATKLTFEYFDKKPGNLLKYVDNVNSIDIWLDTTPEFIQGMNLNDLFWYYKPQRFFNVFVNNTNKDKIKQDLKTIKTDRDNYFKKCINKKLIYEQDISLITFCDEYITWLQILYPGKKFYINATSYGRIQVRVGDWITDKISEDIKNLIREYIPKDKLINIGGHHRAFSLSHEGRYNTLEITDYIQYINKIISERII